MRLIGAFALVTVSVGCTDGYLAEHDRPAASTSAALTNRNAVHSNNMKTNGFAVNGINLNGITHNGILLNGILLNGILLNGVQINGIDLDEVTLNGILLNGILLNGILLNGILLNGILLNGIHLGDVLLDGHPLDEDQVASFKRALGYMSACALEENQCITAYDIDGSPFELCGEDGIDPGWATSPPDLTKSSAVGMCFMDRAAAAGDDVSHSPVQLPALKTILRYLIECSLDSTQSVTIYDETDVPVEYYGALGLAPEWRDEPITPRGQRLVSACLAARSNANGQPVQISLRDEQIPTGANERDLFDHHEGAFSANLFLSEPYIRACTAAGGGLSGRTCTESDQCGFTLLGACDVVCDSQTDFDGSYDRCADDDAMINVFLNVGQQVGFGSRHGCFKDDEGAVQCWGRNRDGELGTGVFSAKETTPDEVVELGDNVSEVMSGFAHTCARKRTGELFCWGKNSQGQLGLGFTGDHAIPTHVETLGADVATVGMGRNHSCAHKTDGTLWCWGKNSQGQLGDGTCQRRTEPVQVTALGSTVAEVSAGTDADFTCAVDNGGNTWCWGKNSYGQLGDGTFRARSTPTRVATDAHGEEFDEVTDVCVGKQHACSRRSNGEVWCWGSDSNGQLGNDDRRRHQRRPVRVALDGDAALHGLSCGSEHTCTLMTDGTMQCWGRNRDGQLGDGSFRTRRTPVEVIGLDAPIDKLTLASRHSCAIEQGGQIWCWGRDSQNVLFEGRVSNVPVALDFSDR